MKFCKGINAIYTDKRVLSVFVKRVQVVRARAVRRRGGIQPHSHRAEYKEKSRASEVLSSASLSLSIGEISCFCGD